MPQFATLKQASKQARHDCALFASCGCEALETE